MTTRFIYQDAKGDITAREVFVLAETDGYLEGRCVRADALRTFRKDRVLEFFSNPAEEAERLAYWLAHPPALPVSDRRPDYRRSARNTGLEICFTGFAARDKARLKALAIENGMVVRESVTLGLDVLCIGRNAGPKKLEQALDQCAAILTEAQFVELLETGALPDETPWIDSETDLELPPITTTHAPGPPVAMASAPLPVSEVASPAPAPLPMMTAVPALVASARSWTTAPRLFDLTYLVVLVGLFAGAVLRTPTVGEPASPGWALGWLVLMVGLVWRVDRGMKDRGRGVWMRLFVGPVMAVALGCIPLVLFAIGWLPTGPGIQP